MDSPTRDDRMERKWQQLSVLVADCGSMGKRHARVLHGLGLTDLRACDLALLQRDSLWEQVQSKSRANRFLQLRNTMEHNLQHTMSILSRTPGTLHALLRDLPEAWTNRNEGEDTWSAFEVVGHLIHGERTDWMPRARIVLQFGEAQPFEPFDRWGQVRESQGKSLALLLDEFTRLRSQNLIELRALNLRQVDLERRGRHPALGVVTLSELLATWATHDLTHLHQISRVLAHQYREAVGPWSKYLGVLQCSGHSSSS